MEIELDQHNVSSVHMLVSYMFSQQRLLHDYCYAHKGASAGELVTHTTILHAS
jgi:hypothetical protein